MVLVVQENKPKVCRLSYDFTQEGNTLGTTSDPELLTIDCEWQLPDPDEKPFFVIKTDGWSIDSLEDLEQLFDHIKKALCLD